MELGERMAGFPVVLSEPEDEPLRAARARSEEADIRAVSLETGALLRFFARLLRARHVVEVGSGGGYSGLWLLGGMEPRGALTTIELDPDRQALAQRAYAEGRRADRVRSMLGPALSVLSKLADANYDIVFLDAVRAEYPDYLPHALRLLRPGGLLLADRMLDGGPDSADSADAAGARAFGQAVADDPALVAVLLPLANGLLAAIHQPAP